MKSIPNGTYRHYKGNLYEVLGTAKHSETEEWHVVYKTCYGDFSTWIRPLSMFTETIDIDGKPTPRFEYLRNKPAAQHANTFTQKNNTDDNNSDVLSALNEGLK